MALDLTPTAYVSRDSAFGLTAFPITMVAWFKLDDQSVDRTVLWIGDKDHGSKWSALEVLSTGRVLAICHNYGSGPSRYAQTSTSLVGTGTWYAAVAVFTSTTSRDIYVDYLTGKSSDETASNTQSVGSQQNTHDRVAIGYRRDSTPNQPWDGPIARAAMFDFAFTADQAAAFCAGYWPRMIGEPAFHVEGLEDSWESVEGAAMTESGTIAKAEHPPVMFPPRLIFPVPAPAGGGGAISASGSIVFTGAASLKGTGDLAASGSLALTGAAVLKGTGDLAAAGTLALTGAADLNGRGTLAASGLACTDRRRGFEGHGLPECVRGACSDGGGRSQWHRGPRWRGHAGAYGRRELDRRWEQSLADLSVRNVGIDGRGRPEGDGRSRSDRDFLACRRGDSEGAGQARCVRRGCAHGRRRPEGVGRAGRLGADRRDGGCDSEGTGDARRVRVPVPGRRRAARRRSHAPAHEAVHGSRCSSGPGLLSSADQVLRRRNEPIHTEVGLWHSLI